MHRLKIQLKDQPSQEIETESLSALDALRKLDVKDINRVVAVKIKGKSEDLSTTIDTASEIEPIFIESKESLRILFKKTINSCHGYGSQGAFPRGKGHHRSGN